MVPEDLYRLRYMDQDPAGSHEKEQVKIRRLTIKDKMPDFFCQSVK